MSRRFAPCNGRRKAVSDCPASDMQKLAALIAGPMPYSMHRQFFQKYSTPEYKVVTTTTAITAHRRASTWGKAINTHSPSMVLAVFTFPDQPAAITVPFPAATSRRPVTANSRVSTTIKAQAGHWPHWQNMAIAAITRSLSAKGSKNLPKSLT